MIATVLVDMRMHGPDGLSVAPTADTASSLFEMESSVDVQSMCPSSLDNDQSSLASEEVSLDDVDLVDRKPKCSVRKRRFKGNH